tara:strand:- start:11213 stop:11896 length:684 start_codon:yes stop_codon:yes gene_type:complete
MKKLLLVLIIPFLSVGQNIKNVSELDFKKSKNIVSVKEKKFLPSFISLYSYDLEKETPLLSIKTKQENMFTIMENKSDCTDNFTLIELANFFDLDYWLLLKSNLDGGSQSILINKINGTDCYLGYSGYMKENIMNDLIFFSNNYFIISYNNGCDEMYGCDIGFGLFKIEDKRIKNIYSTNKWFSSSIKWISNNEIKIVATSLELVYDEDSDTETEKKTNKYLHISEF